MKQKGFTLIELLVVIAIIGILSSVVLASLNSTRARGANTAVKSNLVNIRAQAELTHSNNGGSYLSPTSVCAEPTIVKAMTSAMNAGTATSIVTTATLQTTLTVNCHVAANTWVVSAPLKSAEGSSVYWCVDSTGLSVGRVTPLAAAATSCPTS